MILKAMKKQLITIYKALHLNGLVLVLFTVLGRFLVFVRIMLMTIWTIDL